MMLETGLIFPVMPVAANGNTCVRDLVSTREHRTNSTPHSVVSQVEHKYPVHHSFLSSACPTGYEGNGDRCYKHVTTAVTGDAAQAACAADGSNLVTIDDATENEYIKQKMRWFYFHFIVALFVSVWHFGGWLQELYSFQWKLWLDWIDWCKQWRNLQLVGWQLM